MLTKEDVVRFYNEREVVEELGKRESASQSLNDPKLQELEEAINYLSQKHEDLVKDAIADLRQKKDTIIGDAERALSQRLQLWGFAQVTDLHNPTLDLLLPIKSQAVNGVGKDLFAKVRRVLEKYGTLEVTDFEGYTAVQTPFLSYQGLDLAFLELSVSFPELTRYNAEFGIYRLYPQLAEMPIYLAGIISDVSPRVSEEEGVGRTSRRRTRGRRASSLHDKIEAYIREHGPSSPSDLVNGIADVKAKDDVKAKAIRDGLYYMSKRGRLVHLERNKYTLPKP